MFLKQKLNSNSLRTFINNLFLFLSSFNFRSVKFVFKGSFLSLLLFCLFANSAEAQTPGLIYKPSTSVTGRAVLDPNSDGYTSANSAGFSSSDFGTASELKMVAIPQLDLEPSGDLATGSSGGHTDMVDASTNKKSVFVMSDGTNLIIRFRIGNASTASKGYSLLIDTDGTFAGTGANLGFEQEIVLETGTNGRIAVYNHTSVVGSLTSSYNIDEHQQRSVALTTDGSNPDYFYDFFVPLSAISGSPVRFAAVTITSAGSGIVGTISDVNGVNDLQYNSNVPAMLKAVIASFPPTSLTTLTTGATFSVIKTTTPYISSSLLTTSTSVSGTSSEPNGTTITVYKGGISIGTTTVISNAWSLTGIAGGTFAAGNAITAKAQDISAGKSLSDVSNTVVVGQVCTSAPVITGEVNGAKGYTGSWTPLAGQSITANTVRIYIHGISAETATIGGKNFVTGEAFTITTDYNGNPVYVLANPTVGASSTWSFQLFNQGNSVPNGTFWATAENIGTGSCVSITSNLQYRIISPTTAPVITSSPVYDTNNQVTGTKVTNAKLLFYVNGVERLTISATPNSTSWTATGLNLVVGDKLTAKAIVDGTSGLSDASNEVTVQDQLNGTAVAPVIKGSYNNTQTSISGTSSEATGTVITVFKNGVSMGTATVTIFGTWTLTGITLQTGNLLTAKATAENKNESVLSATVTVLGPTTNIPSVNSPVYANSTSIGGTLASETLKVYIDGEPLSPSLNSQSGTWNYSTTQLASLVAELYAGAKITATNTESGKLESAKSSSVTVIGVNNYLVEKAGGGNIATQTAGISFPISVIARDAANSTFTTYTSTNVYSTGSTISSGAGPTANFSSGILSTHNITLTKAGSYSLTTVGTSNPGVTGTSNVFVINPSSPASLGIFQQPSATGTSEVTLVQQPKIYVYDQFGNHVITDNTTQVIVSTASGTGTLNGVKTLTAINGIITFSGLNIQGSGAFTLQFAASGLTSVTTSVITIAASTPAAPSNLTYTTPNTFNTGAAIIALNPTVTGTVASYSVGPALPAGLTLNTGTGIISGTPTLAVAQANYTVTATNSGGSTDFVISITVTGGAAPVASVVAISGTTTVGQTLTGSHTFTDADGDLQGTSTFRWLSSATADGAYAAITGATSSTYILVTGDQSKFIKYEVTPVAATGSPVSGTAVLSSATAAIIGRAPAATSVAISGTTTVGQTLTGSYTFTDADGDLQGTSTFRWLSSATVNGTYDAIAGATSSTYILVSADQSKFIKYEVTPVAATGSPISGTAVLSSPTTAIIGRAPAATSVAISGTTTVGQTLTGSYTFTDADSDLQGTSTFRWLSSATADGTYTAITGVTSSTYILVTGDQSKFIKYEVTPVAATGSPISGTAVLSSATAAIQSANANLPVFTYASPQTLTKSFALAVLSPVNTGGAVISYTISPELPAGLRFNTSIGEITGTPAGISPQSTYVVTGTNSQGSIAFNLVIKINDVAPLFTYSSPQAYTKGASITALSPLNTGGAVLFYSVNPSLPAGLNINSTSGLITGTPAAASAQKTYFVSGTNSGGTATFEVVIGVKESLPVVAYTNPLIFILGSNSNVSPVNAGGSVSSYSLNMPLPSGLILNTTTGTISGIPEKLSESSSFLLTATNASGSSSFNFTIEVQPAKPKLEILLFATNPVKQSDGSFSINYRIRIANLGNTHLSNLAMAIDLNKVFPAPVKFRLIGTPKSSGSGVISNSIFNGVSNFNLLSSVDQPESNMAVQNTFDEPRYLAGDLNKEDLMGILLSPERLNSFKDAALNNLVFGSSQLAMSDTASVTFIVNIMPNGHMGPYSMEVLGTAESPAGEVVSESSTDGRLVINTGITSVKYPTIVSLLPNSQIASSLNVQEVIRIDDNSYDVKFRAKLINSGNLNLSKVKLLADLKKQFRASSTFRITDFVFVQNEGIVRNYLFDGSSITNLLTSESAISVNKEDVLDFTINLNPNGTYGDYSLQLTAEAFSFDLDESISVKSASGLDPMSSLLNPANNLASVFTIAAPGPRNLLLDNDLIDENNSLNALVGKMSAIDANSAAVLSYSLVSGSGDTDNNNFSFSGSSLLAVQVLDYEKVSSYSIRVRVSNHFSQFTEKNFTIRVKDVNELPTLDAIADLRLFSTTGQQTIALNNLTAGPEASQKVTATVRVDNETLFDNIAIVGNQLRYNIKGGVAGKVNITITVIDDGDLLSGGAKSIERSFNLSIDPLPTISAEPLIISKGFTSNLRVISSAPATYAWSPSTGLSRTDIPNPVARPLQTTTYTVTVINQFGFSINLNVTITVNEDFNLMIPNVFSPNGDRQNDLWVIENIESYPDHELTILDRSGRVLKKVKNYQNDWDGLANGLPLEEGTYYYTIRFIEKNVLKKGFVTLVR